MFIFRFWLLVFLLLWLAADASAQAWPQAKGRAYVKLSHGRTATDQQFRFDGETRPYADNVDDDAFFDRSFYLYGEYGLTHDLTLVAMLPYKSIRVLDAAFAYKTRGLGSVMLGVRQNLKGWLGLAADQHALAANVMATLPTGYTRNFSPSIGSGQVDVQATVNYGLSLYPIPGYGQVGLGYRYRSAFYGFSDATDCQEGSDLNCVADVEPKYDDELLFSAEAGFSAEQWALVQVLGQGVWSIQPPDASTSFSVRNPIPTRQRYIKLGTGLTLYPVRRLGVGVQVFFTPYGRNTIRSTDTFFGVEYRI